MITPASHDPILNRFRAAVTDLYGARLDRVVLFGSRARGEARPDSDYDVAVFLNDMPNRFEELDRLAILSVHMQDDTGALFDAKPYPAANYNDGSPLMWEIRRDGLTL